MSAVGELNNRYCGTVVISTIGLELVTMFVMGLLGAVTACITLPISPFLILASICVSKRFQ